MRIYFETTVFNRYFEDGREYSTETKRLFDMIPSRDIEAFTSAAVLEEINNAPESKRRQMLDLIKRFHMTVLEVDQPAYDLADIYVEMGIIPARYRLDGVHIAMAAVNDLDCIVSLNFHHINKLKTKTATEIINRMKGYTNPYICTPMEVTVNEKGL
ncbi:MAG: PIN domain-containing protein [Oscillospiraceae bacterium]|nr:PIN domain-containing protein [Oscillospiraceae bacterium]